tara:strand:- start:353 stop:901 length:549 start_codon:yes stop_codon:yes gene_type:complete
VLESNAELPKYKRKSNAFKAKQLNIWIHTIVEENPKVTLKEIADEIGRTKERVRQLINDSHKDNDLKPIHRIKRRGGINPEKKDFCIDGCGKSVYKVFRKKFTSPEYICRDCRKKRWEAVKISCSNCGKTFSPNEGYKYHRRLYKKKAKYPDLDFCGKTCLGEYSGKNFGFGANRRNINRRW